MESLWSRTQSPIRGNRPITTTRGAVDRATYDQVPTIKGSKSNHFFMGRPGSELVVSKVSCTCMSCLQGDVGSCSEGVRAMLGPYERCVLYASSAPVPHLKSIVKNFGNAPSSYAIQSQQKKRSIPTCLSITPIPNRQKAVSLQEGSDDGVEPDVGDSVRSFMLAQLLVKKMPAVKMPSTLSRSAVKIRVAYAEMSPNTRR